jgi:hypothetical protein
VTLSLMSQPTVRQAATGPRRGGDPHRRRCHGLLVTIMLSAVDGQQLYWFAGFTRLVGAAVLRVAGGVFYGIGDPPSEDPTMAEEASEETSETDEAKGRTPCR